MVHVPPSLTPAILLWLLGFIALFRATRQADQSRVVLWTLSILWPLVALSLALGFKLRSNKSIDSSDSDPFQISESQATGLDPLLAKSPELLMALILGSWGTSQVENLGKQWGFKNATYWDIYRRLINGSSRDFVEFKDAITNGYDDSHFDRISGQPIRTSKNDFLKLDIDDKNSASGVILAGIYITRIYLSDSPIRTKVLREVKPKLRRILETAFPDQVPTMVSTEIGSLTRVSWTEKAKEKEAKIRRLQAEVERLNSKCTALSVSTEILSSKVRADEAQVKQANLDGERAGEEKAQREIQLLREGLQQLTHESVQAARRHDLNMAQVTKRLSRVTEERNRLDLSLYPIEEAAKEQVVDISGMKIMVVGGLDNSKSDVARALEDRGAELVHYTSVEAATAVSNVRLVVFHTSRLSHSEYYRIKRACRSAEVPFTHWNGSSIAGLQHAINEGLRDRDELGDLVGR